MTLMIETVTPPESGKFRLKLQLAADILVSADSARRRVSTFVGEEIADLLYGERPDLVWQERGVSWRVPVVLSSRALGRIGVVGAIDVDVKTGELIVSADLIQALEENAQRLAAGAAL